MDYDKFVVQIGQSAMLSSYASSLAWMVPAVEIVIAVLLAFETLRLRGLLASFSIMVMFTTYIYIVLQFTDRPPCSCGGILEKLGWVEHLIFNTVFVVLAIIAIGLHHALARPVGNGLPRKSERI